MSLSKLAHLYNTDKHFSWHPHHDGDYGHSYIPFYEQLFHGRIVNALLEIGIESGASLRMWRDYFPDAMIFGIDIDPKTLFQEDRIITVHGNAALPTELTDLAPYDIIIDDGSHEPDEQIAAAKNFLRLLHPGGVYVIEDIRDGQSEYVLNGIGQGRIVEFETWRRSDDRVLVIGA